MMDVKQRHRIAESQVEKLLRAARRHAPELTRVFPRPLDQLAGMSTDDLRICFESSPLVTDKFIQQKLHEKYGIRRTVAHARDREYYGHLSCRGKVVVIFYSTGFGEQCARFSVAHELGHLFLEYVDTFAASGQHKLFEDKEEPSLVAADATDASSDVTSFRERKANWFATELLAPYRQVGIVLRDVKDRAERVAGLCSYFGLSRKAAQIRVDELFEANDQQQTMDFASTLE